MDRNALIIGILGQDGAYLSRHLLAHGYKVFGAARGIDDFKKWRLTSLHVSNDVTLFECDSMDKGALKKVLVESAPSEIYFLAGNSLTYSSLNSPFKAIADGLMSITNLLDLCVEFLPNSRIFLAGSSEMFGSRGHGDKHIVDDGSKCMPINPYGLGKLNAYHLARIYRSYHKLYVSIGILFNHESPLRSKAFVTRKITHNLARLKVLGGGEPLMLGNIDMQRDWSLAEDVVAGMRLSLQPLVPHDYVFASGVLRSVREFFTIAAKKCGFDPEFNGAGLEEVCCCKKTGQKLLGISTKHFRVLDTSPFAGEVSATKSLLGWSSSGDLQDLIGGMVEADILRWQSRDLVH